MAGVGNGQSTLMIAPSAGHVLLGQHQAKRAQAGATDATAPLPTRLLPSFTPPTSFAFKSLRLAQTERELVRHCKQL
jgi:hypothetical protein